MNRALIFPILFPPLVLVVYVASTGLVREGLPSGGFLFWLVGIAYLLGIIPAWLIAGIDGALSGKPVFVRVIAATSVAAILTEAFALYMGQPSFEWQVLVAGAIPAAMCSWLSDKSMRSQNGLAT